MVYCKYIFLIKEETINKKWPGIARDMFNEIKNKRK